MALSLLAAVLFRLPAAAAAAAPAASPPETIDRIEKEAAAYFEAAEADRAARRFDPASERLLLKDEPAVRRAVWRAYRAAGIHAAAKKDFGEHVVRFEKYVSPYTVREVGKRPVAGRPLVIAMHGGGGAPKAVNDQQWEIMQVYYRDQPSVTGYTYVALRAPNDVWNGFYDNYVPPLIINLIRQFTLFGDVDPDKVYLIGYSHGGYGAFFVGPKIPDRFAAVHASAGAPTPGTISAVNLRNTRFTFMVGDQDNAYGRRDGCERFAKEIDRLKEANKGDYPVEFELKKGFGHGGLPDRDRVKELYAYTRSAAPRRLTWEPTDGHIRSFYWLSIDKPAKGQAIDAVAKDNTIEVTTRGVEELDLNLDARLVDMNRPLRLVLNGKSSEVSIQPGLKTLCDSFLARGDPGLAYSAQVHLFVGK